MTQVARVFVFLNLVLAAGFLAASATFLGLNQGWKDQYKAKDKQLAEAQSAAAQEKSDLTNQIAELRQQNGALNNTKTQLETDLRNRDGEVAQLKLQITEKDNQIRTISANAQTLTQAVESLRTDKNNLVTKSEAEAEKARDAVAKMTAALSAKEAAEKESMGLRDTINGLEVAATQMQSKNRDLEAVVAYAQQFVDLSGIAAATPVEGLVLNYDGSLKLVQVNKGESDGVKRGYLLDITSGGRYLGRMKVDGVTPNSAHGTLTVMASGVSSIPVGARATNRLN